MAQSTGKVWFLTGTSKGFGRIWAEAALERGDRVVATARDVETVRELEQKYGDRALALALDVTDKAAVGAAVARTLERFGRIDIAVNNAGYGQFGMVEELSEAEARAQMETNLFGALWVTQAVLPHMRAQKSGHIIQVSSIGGINAFPAIGMYHASKWALEGISQSLAQEVASFGIHVTLVEPAGYSTDWSGPSAKHATPISAYDPVREARAKARSAAVPGDPDATGPAILKVVDAEKPPLRIFFGTTGLPMTKTEYASRISLWEEWNGVSTEAQGQPKN